jgi:hypothetical protein
MDADTLAALNGPSGIYQRLAALEAGQASLMATQANTANAASVASAQAIANMQEQAILTQQAREAAWAAINHPAYTPPPGWHPGMPYPLHG